MSDGTEDGRSRCPWAKGALLQAYHDDEWGVPRHDDQAHLEALVLDGAQAGLSWELILRRRPAYRAAFQDFDPDRMAAMRVDDVDRLLENPGLIRHRGKLESAIRNAEAFQKIREEWGSFDRYVWSWVSGVPEVHAFRESSEVPAEAPVARALSRDLKRRGFSFVGPIICYSYLQGVGVMMDHLVSCYRHRDLAGTGAR